MRIVKSRNNLDVLFVSSWYPSKLDATVGNFVERHALALISEGHRVVVMHETSSHRIWLPAVEFNIQSGIPVFHLFVPKLLRNAGWLRWMLAKKALQKISSDHFVPDIVHGHVLYPIGPMALKISKSLNRPLVFTEHWSGFQPVNAHLITKKMFHEIQQTINHCTRVLPVSKNLKHAMQKLGLEANFETVYNSVDTKLFNTQETKRSERFTFLHISNFAPGIKNTEGIIDAYADLLKANDQPLELIIAGDGDIDRLKSYVQKHYPQVDSIRFLGTLEYPEVAQLMKRSSCFVLFSNYENLPCVVAEAHCCGMPVIATEVGGLSEMVNESNGVLVEPRDAQALSAAMDRVMKNYAQFQPELIEKVAAERYGYPEIAKQFEQIYRASIQSE